MIIFTKFFELNIIDQSFISIELDVNILIIMPISCYSDVVALNLAFCIKKCIQKQMHNERNELR
ncbi:hypothetical protein T4D_15817 [Trichinella pseudospiralis]|uniref:Uncharacterized protein n=1 Tax=Trichinella pseudospiralis TaxID=6337 RepID=A0A0V1FT10_TRIPS|nr:hypothetical protein T4D_15817 [Trichinella pseudospiralis]